MGNNMMGLLLHTAQLSILKINHFFGLKREESIKKQHKIHYLGDGMYACLVCFLLGY